MVVATACAGDAQLGKRTQPEDEAGVEHDVDRVREPQRTHRDRGVAGTAEDRVDQKQKHRAAPAQHHARVASADRLHGGARPISARSLGAKRIPSGGGPVGDHRGDQRYDGNAWRAEA